MFDPGTAVRKIDLILLKLKVGMPDDFLESKTQSKKFGSCFLVIKMQGRTGDRFKNQSTFELLRIT